MIFKELRLGYDEISISKMEVNSFELFEFFTSYQLQMETVPFPISGPCKQLLADLFYSDKTDKKAYRSIFIIFIEEEIIYFTSDIARGICLDDGHHLLDKYQAHTTLTEATSHTIICTHPRNQERNENSSPCTHTKSTPSTYTNKKM